MLPCFANEHTSICEYTLFKQNIVLQIVYVLQCFANEHTSVCEYT